MKIIFLTISIGDTFGQQKAALFRERLPAYADVLNSVAIQHASFFHFQDDEISQPRSDGGADCEARQEEHQCSFHAHKELRQQSAHQRPQNSGANPFTQYRVTELLRSGIKQTCANSSNHAARKGKYGSRPQQVAQHGNAEGLQDGIPRS